MIRAVIADGPNKNVQADFSKPDPNRPFELKDVKWVIGHRWKQRFIGVVSGEVVTKKLLAAKGKQERYFRHPYLNTGATPEKKSAFDKIIADNHYTVAPVTVDNGDYIFASVYADALKKNDRAMMPISRT